MEVSEEFVRGVLAPHEPYLAYCVIQGWSRYLDDIPAAIRVDLTQRGQANILWDLIASVAEARATDTAGLILTRTNNTMFVNVGNDLVVRFKKLSGSGGSSNLQTVLQMDYREQLPIQGLGDVPRVDVGYRLDHTEMNFEAVMVACPSGRGAAWHYDIPSARADEFGSATERTPAKVTVRGRHLRVIRDTGTEPNER